MPVTANFVLRHPVMEPAVKSRPALLTRGGDLETQNLGDLIEPFGDHVGARLGQAIRMASAAVPARATTPSKSKMISFTRVLPAIAVVWMIVVAGFRRQDAGPLPTFRPCCRSPTEPATGERGGVPEPSATLICLTRTR
jgi:hypothetical protein